MNDSPFQQLKAHLAEVHNLEMAGAVLGWDQETYMPPGGVGARADQRATISKLSHNLFTGEKMARLLEAAERAYDAGAAASDDSDEAALLRVTRRDFDKATKLPESLVVELTRTSSLANSEWAQAREDSNYAHFAPWLEKLIDLQRQVAQAYGYEERMYDALLDQYEQGMTCSALDPIFEELKNETIPLVHAVRDKQHLVSDAILHREYDVNKQREFAEAVIRDCGFDWTRGRQDVSVHPFCTNFSSSDVRITTRYSKDDLQSALFGSLHEMGHALYEQGIASQYDATPLSGGVSLGVHESQSRMWENLVGRSRPFWSHYFSRMKAVFPAQLGDVSEPEFYRAINYSSPSLIRVEADELTYNLHIILRYEIENELLEGTLSVADAPDSWNARMEKYLGLVPPTDREGILQDVHWSYGSLGYFPTYSLGNILSVQLWEKALEAAPQIPEDIAQGKFDALLSWLRENVHQCGRKYPPQELVQRASGSPLTVKPYADYLRAKFGEIYEL